jgi:hypothetical protein
MKKEYIIGMVVAIIGVLGLMMFLSKAESGPGPLDEFAKCLGEKKAIFYGAFWCQHCQAQKKMFGPSKQYLPYQECSTADAKGQLKECADVGIETYPTWVFADGSKLTGEVPLETLAEKTGCLLPGTSPITNSTTTSAE